MKLFVSESEPDYARLRFPWRVRAQPSSANELAAMYGLGFLPASYVQPAGKADFYLARSARVRLASYAPGKDERYSIKKAEEAVGPVTSIVTSPGEALDLWPGLLDFCIESAARFAPGAFSYQRVRFLLVDSVANTVVLHSAAQGIVGCLLVVASESTWHAWYNFHIDGQNLGRFSLLRGISLAEEAGLAYAYVGTVYGKESRYKRVPGMEFFDGGVWSADMRRLSVLTSSDPPKKEVQSEPTGELLGESWMELDAALRAEASVVTTR